VGGQRSRDVTFSRGVARLVFGPILRGPPFSPFNTITLILTRSAPLQFPLLSICQRSLSPCFRNSSFSNTGPFSHSLLDLLDYCDIEFAFKLYSPPFPPPTPLIDFFCLSFFLARLVNSPSFFTSDCRFREHLLCGSFCVFSPVSVSSEGSAFIVCTLSSSSSSSISVPAIVFSLYFFPLA